MKLFNKVLNILLHQPNQAKSQLIAPIYFNPEFLAIKTNSVNQLNLMMQYKLGYQLHPEKKIELHDTGFSVFSQHEEDGILLFIFSLIGTTNKKCVEVCAGNGIECNTANLLVNHKWVGLLLDGNEQNISHAKKFYAACPTTMHWPPRISKAWITAENVNQLLEDHGFIGEIDLLSLDIDGIDYWLLKALTIVRPRVIVLEINHLIGPEESLSVPYKPDFVAEFTEYGSDYAGASLAAFIKLGREKGYRFVGANSIATNAFFVRDDLPHEWLPERDPKTVFDHPRAQFGMSLRYEKVKNKEWVKV